MAETAWSALLLPSDACPCGVTGSRDDLKNRYPTGVEVRVLSRTPPMNIFLIHPQPFTSASQLFARDPIRANKQIVECTQLLAFVEIRRTGTCTLLKADGQPYRATKAQLNHPISVHMSYQRSSYDLCWSVLEGLLAQRPSHACAASMRGYENKRLLAWKQEPEYIVCRRGYSLGYVKTLEDYSLLMLRYLTEHKWAGTSVAEGAPHKRVVVGSIPTRPRSNTQGASASDFLLR